MKRTLKFLIAVFAVSAVCGCKNEDNPVEPGVEPQETAFSITADLKGATYAYFSVKPQDKTVRYILNALSKEQYSALHSDEKLIEANNDSFKDLAEKYGLTVEEVIDALTDKGDTTGFKLRYLDADTDYYAYAYGIGSDGTPLTDVVKYEFRTSSLTNNTIEVSTEPTTSSCKVQVVPSDRSAFYYFSIAKKTDLKDLTDTDIAASFYSYFTKYLTQHQDAVLTDLFSTGQVSYEFANLIPSTDYVVLAYYLNEEGDRLSAVTRQEFKTPELNVVDDCKFEFSSSKVYTSSFNVKVVPSNSSTRYYIGIISKTDWDKYTPDEVAAALINQANSDKVDWSGDKDIFSGTKDLNTYYDLRYGHKAFKCNTEYVVVAFGVDSKGERTTAVGSFVQKTAPRPESFPIEISVSDLTSTGVLVKYSVADTTVVYYPSMIEAATVDTNYGGDITKYAEYDLNLPFGQEFVEQLLKKGVHTEDYNGWVEPNTEYVVYGFAYAGGERISDVSSLRFKTPAGESASAVKKVIDFRKSFLENLTRSSAAKTVCRDVISIPAGISQTEAGMNVQDNGLEKNFRIK